MMKQDLDTALSLTSTADPATVAFNITHFRILSIVSLEALVLLKNGCIDLLEDTRNRYQEKWERVEVNKAQFAHLIDADILTGMSIEIISVLGGQPDHVHYHNNSYALLTTLGESEGYPEPVECTMFFKSKQGVPAVSGVTLQVEPGVLHSFANGKSILSFLSVQSSKIEEDYHFAK